MPEQTFTDEQLAKAKRIAEEVVGASQPRYLRKDTVSRESPKASHSLIWDATNLKWVPKGAPSVLYIPFGSEPITGQSYTPP